jgi:hypothetical protein
LSLGTTWADEHFYALPKWVSSKQLFFSNIPTSRLDILDGKANVKEISRSSTVHTYRIDALSPLKIRENTLYFPGWNVTSNGKQIIAYPDSRGIIEFILPTGIQYVNVTYEDIFPFYILKLISGLGIITFCILLFILLLKNKLVNLFF